MDKPRRRHSDQDYNANSPLTALLVDEDARYLSYVEALARRSGFDVDTAGDGETALEKVASRMFDLVMIDHEMPFSSGLDLITAIRSSDSLRDAYAVMLTTHDDVDMKITALTSGYDDFLAKGCADVEIVARLAAARRVVSRQRKLDSTVRELYGLAMRDELTGLANRRYFTAEAEWMLRHSSQVSIVLFDLNEFKCINDTLGHLVGDAVLRDLGAQIRRSTRSEDLFARWGGDEFAMVVPDTPLEDVEGLARRLTKGIEALRWRVGAQEVTISASVGIGTSKLLDSPTVEQILEAADRDLYKNKWIRKHPDTNPELYEYPAADGRTITHPAAESPLPVKRKANTPTK